ncbi:IS3 family transposase [Corynebacterium freiburgense]|uniref:IS3 family transposase n=1 Tax=Corynebacterium freiburgense TaxID=556548 RepID=UPI0012EB6FF2
MIYKRESFIIRREFDQPINQHIHWYNYKCFQETSKNTAPIAHRNQALTPLTKENRTNPAVKSYISNRWVFSYSASWLSSARTRISILPRRFSPVPSPPSPQ